MLFKYPDTWTVHDDVTVTDPDTGETKRVQGPARQIEVPRETIVAMWILDLTAVAVVLGLLVALVVSLAT